MTRRRSLLLTGLVLLSSACAGEDKPPMQVAGGGFVFNYRISQLTYGVVVRQLRPLPEGSTIEASFDLPGTAEKFVLEKPARTGTLQYSFESKPLQGVKKGDAYTVRIRVRAPGLAEDFYRLERTYTADVDQSTLPSKPLVKGPGYEPAEP